MMAQRDPPRHAHKAQSTLSTRVYWAKPEDAWCPTEVRHFPADHQSLA